MAKSDKAKLLPKTIAGFKVPKALREAEWLASLASSAAGREVLAEALTKGAEAAAAVLLAHKDQSPEETADSSGHEDAAPESDAATPVPKPARSRRTSSAPAKRVQTAAPSAET